MAPYQNTRARGSGGADDNMENTSQHTGRSNRNRRNNRQRAQSEQNQVIVHPNAYGNLATNNVQPNPPLLYGEDRVYQTLEEHGQILTSFLGQATNGTNCDNNPAFQAILQNLLTIPLRPQSQIGDIESQIPAPNYTRSLRTRVDNAMRSVLMQGMNLLDFVRRLVGQGLFIRVTTGAITLIRDLLDYLHGQFSMFPADSVKVMDYIFKGLVVLSWYKAVGSTFGMEPPQIFGYLWEQVFGRSRN